MSYSSKLRHLKVKTPGRLFYSLFILFLSIWVTAGWFLSMHARLHPAKWDSPSEEIEAQARCIERRLSMAEDELLVMLIPEGTLFCNSLFGFALVSYGLRYAPDHPVRRRSIERVYWLLQRCEKMAGRHPFTLNKDMKPGGGIILAGHTNLLRAGYLYLGGKDQAVRQAFDRESGNIFDAFIESETGFPECYTGYTWAQDSAFALESLRLHDVLYGAKYNGAIEKWTKAVRDHIDKGSGSMVAQVDPVSGASVEGARGCALAWGLVFLPAFDSEFCQQQYDLFQKNWVVNFLGCAGVHEFYQGKAVPTNFHAGPVVAGLGMAASGLGIVAARSNHDLSVYNRLLRSLELFGIPITTPCGERSYFLGTCLLADVVSLWGKTVVRWDPVPSQGDVTDVADGNAGGALDDYLVAIALVGLFCSAVVGLVSRRLWQLCAAKDFVFAGWRTATVIGITLQALLAAAFFLVPFLSWIQIIIFMAIVDMLEEMSVRPSIMAKLYREQG